MLPLTGVLKGGRGSQEVLEWSEVMMVALEKVKAALARAACLAFSTASAELALATEASATAVGAVLQQKEPGQSSWQLLGFFSKKLDCP